MKDCVQETVSAFKGNHHKMQISQGKELQVPIWHSGTCKAFLIHGGFAMEAIKRKGYFKAYVESNKVYREQSGVIKQVKAQLAELDDSTNLQGCPTRSPM
jgi:hypothetical protein